LNTDKVILVHVAGKTSKMSADDAVKALGLPVKSPQPVHTDDLGWDVAPFKPPIPLMPSYARGNEGWVVETPKSANGVIAIKQLARAFGLVEGELLSGTLLPNQQAVILRPSDVILKGETGLTSEMVDDFTLTLGDRYRLRLPASVASTLNLLSKDERLLIFGRYVHVSGKTAGKLKKYPVFFLFNPLKFVPENLEDEISW
jgi:hypothetical protein